METMNDNRGAQRGYSGAGSTEGLVTLEAVTERRELPSLGARLKALRLWLEDDLAAVEEALSSFYAAPEDSVDRHAAVHMMKVHGKLLRPICVLLASRVSGEREPQVVRDIAVAVELVHSATLMHDDVLDLGNERRGQPTARLMYSNAASVLGGDFLLMRALQLINRHGHADEMTRMLAVIEEMVSAEARQLEFRGRLVLEPSRYLEVISGKTAALFRWALGAGGRLSGLPEAQSEALASFGDDLGMGFQLIDDLLDLMGDSDVLGKDLYADLAEGKMTYPLICAAAADAEVAETIQGLLDNPELRDSAEIGRWLGEVFAQTGADEQTRALARRHVERAIGHLEAIPTGPARTALEAVARTMLSRVR